MAFIPTVSLLIDSDQFRDLTELRKLDLDSSPGLLGAVLDSDNLMTSLTKVYINILYLYLIFFHFKCLQ